MKKVKSKPYKLLAISLILSFTGYLNMAAAPEEGLWAGAEKVLITPQTPIPMSGYGSRKGPFKGIHDDVFARVLVVSDGEAKAAIISVEVIGISNSFWGECTALITKETGIPKEHILLSAVHNHGGPAIRVYNNDESPEVLAYVEGLKNKLVSATKSAIKKLSPATIGAGKGECKMNINRVAPDGKGGMALGRNPYGPCDHEVGVLRVNDSSGNILAVLVNWPCHAVVLGPGNSLITGDWPGAASNFIENELGEGVIAPVIVGASGDINPIYGPHIDFEITSSYAFGKDAIGEDLAKESMRIVKGIITSPKGNISAQQRIISLPLKEEKTIKGQQPGDIKNDSLKVRLSALKIGNIVLTGVSGEVFNQISVKMRAQSPYTNTFMVTHCNGSCGYLVTEDAYDIGGYEVRSTRVQTSAEKAIIETLLDMIAEL
ncbi:MAG: neutral/alkaline non-lysosomal ceramidase N-terminal domain-containing protein [Bacteroidales bacterium]|nr:neutral/alkaline non-lysosomal ceramidase N-terminal domain-containing protein [Bacteroidales bacterium]